MNKFIHSLTLILLTAVLSSCGSAPKAAGEPDSLPKYEDYQSSATYGSGDDEDRDTPRTPSSEPYLDDEYGDVDTDSYGDDSEPQDSEPLLTKEDVSLPLAKPATVSPPAHPAAKKAAPEKTAAKPVGTLAAGMHTFKSNCQMRVKADPKAKSTGQVNKGRKLWVEPHNKEWMKVFKKSGPVYVHRSCL